MHCRSCEYALWNLAARTCPECGAPFRPSEFEFVANSIQFRCPHCRQSYYGTTERGHLDPVEFDCVKCGRRVHMDEMILLPTEGVEDEQTAIDVLPWLERRRIGRVRAWWKTALRSTFGGESLMAAAPPDSPIRDAWRFALLNILVVVLCNAALIFAASLAFGTGMWELSFFILAGAMVGIVPLLFWGLIAHGILLLGRRPIRTIGRTYEAMCYASGPVLLMIVPCLSFYLSPVAYFWWTISAILTVKSNQRISGRRATLAVGGASAFFIAVVIACVSAIAYFSIQGLNAATGGFSAMSTSSVSRAIADHARLHNGAGPDHVARLVLEQSLEPQSFDFFRVPDDQSQLTVGSLTLHDFDAQTQAYSTLDDALNAALPDNVIAYRFGEYVFTYHGIDFNDSESGLLWTAIHWPEWRTQIGAARNNGDSGNGQSGDSSPIVVSRADGQTTVITPDQFAAALQSQNAIRRSVGLPPIPDPATITRANPVVIDQ